VTPNKILFVQFLLEAGINAYRGATQLAYVKPEAGYKDATNSKWLMENVVYLPIHWGMTDNEVRETVERVIECFNKLVAYLKQNDMPKPKQTLTADLLERPRM
jgi:dTDP-4-amino-4,6-dideoxygalactose transaminase